MSIITTPFGWLLLQLYNFTTNYGLAIILFSLIVKVILLPFAMKSKRGMLQQQRLQPRLKELEKRYAGNKAKYNEEVQKIYREEKINPMSGCIWSLIPFPILIALYAVVRQPLSTMMSLAKDQITLLTEHFSVASGTYSQLQVAQKIHLNFDEAKSLVSGVRDIDFSFLGINLAETPDWKFFTKISGKPFSEVWPMLGLFLIPILSAVLAFLSTWLVQKITNKGMPKDSEPQVGAATMKSMNLMMPLISLWIGFVMPGALGIYWCATSFFSIIQEVILTKHYNKVLDALDADRIEKEKLIEAELERKRAETERLKAENATVVNPNTSKKKLQQAEKKTAAEKQAAWEAEQARKNAGASAGADEETGAVGDRPFARGRAYRADRYGEAKTEEKASESVVEADTGEIESDVEENVTVKAESVPQAQEDVSEYDDEPEYDDDEPEDEPDDEE